MDLQIGCQIVFAKKTMKNTLKSMLDGIFVVSKVFKIIVCSVFSILEDFLHHCLQDIEGFG